MMKKHVTNKQGTKLLSILLILLSAAIYLIQILLFRDPSTTAFYMLQDWAFLPIQVVLVTIIAGRIVKERETENRLEKTRMLTSTFFSDLGAGLLERMVPGLENAADFGKYIKVEETWTKETFAEAVEQIRKMPLRMKFCTEHWESLRDYLVSKRMSMLVITSNQALLEHEDFTDMLWAIFHLTDELTFRQDLSQLSPADEEHLRTDAERVMTELLMNWLYHVEHLQDGYPYLYRLEIYHNPLVRTGMEVWPTADSAKVQADVKEENADSRKSDADSGEDHTDDGKRLEQQMAFIRRVDQLKQIGRQTYLSDGSRKENDAEHSWHLALMANLLQEYANEKTDVNKVVLMVLIHDIVEIEAGDTFAYDPEGQKTAHAREAKAADHLFHMLPADQAAQLLGLWNEFEAYETAEAKFAHTLDNCQPLMLNDASSGKSWEEHQVHESAIAERNARTGEGSARIWQYMQKLIARNVQEGHIRRDR